MDWFHIECIKIPQSTYMGLMNDQLFWFCGRCMDSVKDYLDKGKKMDLASLDDGNSNVNSADTSKGIGKKNFKSSVSRIGNWKPVTKGCKPKSLSGEVGPVATGNRFTLLGEAEGEPEVVIMGDSIIRDQGKFLRKRTSRKCTSFCYPGAGVEKITSVLEEQSSICPCPTIVSVGTNDVKTVPSEVLKRKFMKLIRSLQERRTGIVIGILPRMWETQEWSSRALGLNRWLSEQCSLAGVIFVDLWRKYIRRLGFMAPMVFT